MAYRSDGAFFELTNSGCLEWNAALGAAQAHGGLVFVGGKDVAERLMLKLWSPGASGTCLEAFAARPGNDIIQLGQLLTDQDEELKVWRAKLSRAAIKFDVVPRAGVSENLYLRFPLYHHIGLGPIEIMARDDPDVILGLAWQHTPSARLYISQNGQIVAQSIYDVSVS